MIKSLYVACNNNIFINLENEIISGNVLDIGLENYGIFYNIMKNFNDEVSVSYVDGAEESSIIEDNFYDNCVIFFSLNKIPFVKNKRKLVNEVSNYLKEGGNLYIWDIDKNRRMVFSGTVRVLLPDKSMKSMKISNYNPLTDCSKESIVKLLQNKFDIVDLKSSDGIYYIKAEKKKG